jgi:ribosomal protein S18 acetylase RimI-like enzyme
MAFDIRIAQSAADLALIRELFREYQHRLNVDLCFQSFDEELATLPGKYASPRGCLLIAMDGEESVGCVAVRPLDSADDCELKRLYVRPLARGRALGRTLAQRAIAHAKAAGFARMYLDTLPQMTEAQQLYATLGFVDSLPYTNNPIAGTRFMALAL